MTLRRIVELACRAPSIGNTQPWRWVVSGDDLHLYADPSLRVPHSDPAGRQLLVSCGAALHHARVAAAGLGRVVAVRRLPSPADPLWLATLRTRPAPVTPGALEELGALEERHTDRRRFTSWPVPEDRLAALTRAVSAPGVHAVALTERRDRAHVDRLVRLATGDPTSVLPGDGLVALSTDSDTTESRLRAGEALSTLWLHAVRNGLSVVPLSEAVESAATRSDLLPLFGGLVQPQLLVRVGWQEIGGRAEQRSPRRPLAEVLGPRDQGPAEGGLEALIGEVADS